MTNGDKIRKMSNSELVWFLYGYSANRCKHCNLNFHSPKCQETKCSEAMIEWLESEAKPND